MMGLGQPSRARCMAWIIITESHPGAVFLLAFSTVAHADKIQGLQTMLRHDHCVGSMGMGRADFRLEQVRLTTLPP